MADEEDDDSVVPPLPRQTDSTDEDSMNESGTDASDSREGPVDSVAPKINGNSH